MIDVKKIKARLKPVEIEQKTKYFSISNSLEYFKYMMKKYKTLEKKILY